MCKNIGLLECMCGAMVSSWEILILELTTIERPIIALCNV